MLRDNFIWLQDVHVSYAHWFSSVIVREFVSKVYYIYYSINNRIECERKIKWKITLLSQFLLSSFLISVTFFTQTNT